MSSLLRIVQCRKEYFYSVVSWEDESDNDSDRMGEWMDQKIIGKRIKQHREAAGLTQMQLAEALDISPNHLSAIERGIKVPRLETFVKIANRLGVSADTLLTDVVWQARVARACQLDDRLARLNHGQFKIVCDVIETLLMDLENSERFPGKPPTNK